MGSIWKAVTGFFKANSTSKKMETTDTNSITQPEEDANNVDSDSDADDEDFNPNEANEGAVSEENSDGDDEDGDSSPTRKKKTDSKRSGKKRKATNTTRKSVNGTTTKRRRLQRNCNKVDSDDDEEDVDFVVSESHSSKTTGEDDDENHVNAEELAAKEAEEKAETDRLWADFLSSVNEEKERRKKGLDRTVEKVVTKVVDFAGEKISVQEKVKVTVSSSNANSTDITNISQDSPSSSVSTVALSDVSTSNASSSTTTTRVDDEPVPGPSSAVPAANGRDKAKPRRGGISILGNDPETIGLDELDKRGLSGLLKAFQNKAAAAKRIGTLEKSKLDWEQYKRTQGLEEELTHHNKSRDTFIDKQEFLQRTDYRQFEIEKNMRATARSRRLAN